MVDLRPPSHRVAPARRPSSFLAMKSSPRNRAALLIMALTLLFIISGIAASLLNVSLSSYKLTLRNEFRARAQAVAESELEYLFFRFKSECLSGVSADNAAAELTSICDNTEVPTSTFTPFLAQHAAENWRVRRSLITDRIPLQGNLPGTTKTGQFTYVNARIEVLPPAGSAYGDSLNVRIGRRFINSTSTIFQYSIFYEGTLEITPGGNTRIEGDIAANGNVYLGVLSGKTLEIANKIRYLGDHRFNKDALGSTIYYNPDSTTPAVTLAAPTFLTSELSQVETMDAPENLLGGLDATATAESRPDLFGPTGLADPTLWNDTNRETAANNVYRSTIVPPPSASNSNEYPNATTSTGDDPAIEATRAYTRADVIVTINSSGTVSVKKRNGTDLTASFSGTGKAITSNADVRDQREAKDVKMTNVDIELLKTALAANVPDFNGLIYFNLTGASSSTPAAIRLKNAEVLPNIGGTGFSVATNGGIYIQGNYNTKLSQATPEIPGVPEVPATLLTPAIPAVPLVPAQPAVAGKVSSMLMGDALTVLSPGWNDANAAGALSTRIATGAVTVNAGLLTGNVASTATRSSGGAQNLIRFLEDWTGVGVTFHGSIGRLFQSRHFASAFPGAGSVYMPPSRIFSFDNSLAQSPPPGSLSTTSYSRGNFFVW